MIKVQGTIGGQQVDVTVTVDPESYASTARAVVIELVRQSPLLVDAWLEAMPQAVKACTSQVPAWARALRSIKALLLKLDRALGKVTL